MESYSGSYRLIYSKIVAVFPIPLSPVKINKGLVANEYYGWSNVSTTLMIFQIIFITIYIRNSFLVTLKGGTPTQGQKGVIATYFLVLLNTICLGIQQVILEHFTTDG